MTDKSGSLVHSLNDLKLNGGSQPDMQVRRSVTDGTRRSRSRSSKKRRTHEFLRQSSTDIQPPLDNINTLTRENTTESNNDPDGGYRSDTSDNGDDLEEVQSHHEEITPQPQTSSPSHRESEKPVSRLKRTLSGKFRTSSNKVNEGPPPLDDALHKSLSQSQTISTKQFSKLLRRASHIDQVDSKGQSILHLCASRGLLDCIRTLLKKNANVNLQDNMGYTPLHCAAIERKLDSCQILLEAKNIDVTLSTNENSNVLHYLVRTLVDDSNLVLYRRVLDVLIEKGIDINLANKHMEAPIHFACMKSNIHTVAFLLERGADCNLKTALNETPLHYAIRAGSIKLVRMLMESGADPTAKTDGDGTTPVDVAEQYQCADILECLQSIIEEELTLDTNSSVLSPRVRLNESTIIKEGELEVLWNNDWEKLFIQLNKHRIICRRSKGDLKQVCSIHLNNSEVASEEGTIISDSDEQLWCFSVTELPENILSFATKLPEEREEWIDAIELVITERSNLYSIYEKLKSQSKPRKRLRVKERNLGVDNCRDGIRRLTECNTPSLLCDFLVQEPELASAALWKVMSMENETVFAAMVKYLLHRNRFEDFLKFALSHEIRISAVGETLFREMSLCTRMLSCYLDMEPGKEYLRNTVMPLLSDIASNANVQDNLDNIATLSQKFLDQILSSSNQCPFLFRELMRHTRERVDKVFPNMTHAVVGGFVFLRFLCPAIISPHKFGLTKTPFQARKDAVLITKLLQTVSNGVEFDESREGPLRQLNPFIRKNRLFVDVFFDGLTDPKSIAKQRASYVPPKKLSTDEVEGLEQIIFEHMIQYRERMADLLDEKIKICIPIPDDDSDDEHSGVEADYD